MFLPSSPLPKAVPAAGRFRLPLTPFSLWCLTFPSRAARALQKPWLRRRPSHSRLLDQGVLPRPPFRPCLSLPCLTLKLLRRRRHADEQRQQPVMYHCCRLWIRARRGPSTICPAYQHPATSRAVAADPVDSGPVEPVDHLPGVSTPGCESHGRDRSRGPPRPPAHAPLDHASLSFNGLLPPWHHAHVAHAREVSLVDWYECVHPVVASPLLAVRWPSISLCRRQC